MNNKQREEKYKLLKKILCDAESKILKIIDELAEAEVEKKTKLEIPSYKPNKEKLIKTINIAKDFNKAPAGRYRNYGNYSGEAFREDFLIPAFRQYKKVEIVLDGLEGVGHSFFEEAFCGLDISLEEINNKLSFVCSDDITLEPMIKKIIINYIKN